MAGYGDKPFGLHQVRLVRGVTVAELPVAQTLKFKERTKSAELEGNDVIAAVNTIVDAVEWELEAGGISLEAYALMTGRTATAAGTSPNETTSLKGRGGDNYPYFKVYGKVLGSGTDDIHCKIFKAKLSEGMEGTFGQGEFFVTSCKGIAVDDGTNGLWEMVQNETAATLPSS